MGASIRDTLELWASSLRDVKARIRPLFSQERVAASACLFLDGLLGDARRKTGWMRAEAGGDPGPWRQQAILGRSRWKADTLRDIVRDYVVETLCDDDTVPEAGQASCGVGRQYTGSAGKIADCQIGVFASYVSRHGHAFIDRALYLPKAWPNDPAHGGSARAAGHRVRDQARPSLRDDRPGHRGRGAVAWVAADSVYGVGDIETALHREAKGYVLGVNANHRFGAWIGKPEVAGPASGPISNWPISTRLNTNRGAFHPWSLRWRTGASRPTDRCPAGTEIETPVGVEGSRWAIEDSFETATNELGFDHNETRSWHGWHRHVSLVMLAFAMMAAIRHRANTELFASQCGTAQITAG